MQNIVFLNFNLSRYSGDLESECQLCQSNFARKALEVEGSQTLNFREILHSSALSLPGRSGYASVHIM